jgi:hypothetical protein
MLKIFTVTLAPKDKPTTTYNAVATDIHGSISKSVKFARKFFGDESITVRDVIEIKFVSDMSGHRVVT